MSTISQPTQKLIGKYQDWFQSLQPKEGVSFIHVDEVASRVAAFYEKIKGVVDWEEEHLLRKRAIERTLKRRIIFNNEDKEIAESLVYELIRGGHFPNDTIPEFKIEKVQQIIDKYFFLLKNSAEKEEPEKTGLRAWLLEIASHELEKILSPFIREESLIEYMAQLMEERIKVKEEGIVSIKGISEQEKNIQIYIAVQRSLFKLDSATIGYNLLEKQYPEWPGLVPSSPLLSEIRENIYSIKRDIEKKLNHPLADKFYVVCEKYDTPYLILGDIIAEDPVRAEQNLQKPELLEELIKKAYGRRFAKLKKRTRRAAIYSTLSVFITKIVLALAIEIPVDKYLTQQFSYPVLWINILFPPFLMFLLVATIRPPKKENLQRIIMETMKIAYQRDKKDMYEIRAPRKRGMITQGIISGFYFLTFIVSFGIIIYILQKLNFGILSMFIFLFFISVISFFGMRIRERNQELSIEETKETFFKSLFDFFFLPLIRIGKWLSARWSKMNIALIISILVDVPFFTFIGFLEQWRYFLKEKKEEIH
jgi:phosphatidylglycerophosphate synthase